MRAWRHLPPERRVLVGRPPLLAGGIALIAWQAKCHARRLGLEADIFHSRTPKSGSRYLRIPVAWRRWPIDIRISDHARARGTRADFEVISLDGVSGLPEARGFIELVAKGEVA